MAAIVEAASRKLFVSRTNFSCLSSSHTVTRRRSSRSWPSSHKGLQAHRRIGQHLTAGSDLVALDNLNIGVGLESRDKVHTLASPPGEKPIIHIPAVHRDDTSPWKIEVLGHGHVPAFAVGDMSEDR